MVLFLAALVFAVSLLALIYLIRGEGSGASSSESASTTDPAVGTEVFDETEGVQPSMRSRSLHERNSTEPVRASTFSHWDSLLPLVRPVFIVILISLVPGYIYLRFREVEKALVVDGAANINATAGPAQPVGNPIDFQFKYVPPLKINIQPPAPRTNPSPQRHVPAPPTSSTTRRTR